MEVSSFGCGGINPWHRALMYLVWAFRATIELLLLVYGSGYVVRAPSPESLLLNAVSLAFIVKLDDVAYHHLCPDYLKRTKLPVIGLVSGQITGDKTMHARHGMGPMFKTWYKL